MDLLERYLAEIRRNLPARDADDIVAELRDVLTARAEEQEETTGKVDWEGLLRDFGHPLVFISPRLDNILYSKFVPNPVCTQITPFIIRFKNLWQTLFVIPCLKAHI